MSNYEELPTDHCVYSSERFSTHLFDVSESILPTPSWGTPQTSSAFLQHWGLSSSTEAAQTTALTITDHDSLIRQDIVEYSEEEWRSSWIPNVASSTTTTKTKITTIQAPVSFRPEVDVILGTKNKIIDRNKKGTNYYLDQVAHHGDRILEMERSGYISKHIQLEKNRAGKQIMEAVQSQGGQFLVRKNAGNRRLFFCADPRDIIVRTRYLMKVYVGRANGDPGHLPRLKLLKRRKNPLKTKIETLLQQKASQKGASPSSSSSPAAIAAAALSFVRSESSSMSAEKLKNATRNFILKHRSCAKLSPAQVGEILRQIGNASDDPSYLIPKLEMTCESNDR